MTEAYTDNREGENGSRYGPVTVIGLVVPAGWDEKGNILGITISDFNEVEYLVSRPFWVRKLTKLLYETVEVQGICQTSG